MIEGSVVSEKNVSKTKPVYPNHGAGIFAYKTGPFLG
jgi:hypothetical protein